MLKLTSALALSTLSFAVHAADLLTASAAPPAMSIGYVSEGSACPGPGATGFTTSGLLLSCQSGVWSRQPTSSAYDDAFDNSGFALGANYCSSGIQPQRTYVLTLETRSTVFMSLISGRSGGGSFSGIGINGQLCGYNAYMESTYFSTSSANCSFKLGKGTHIFNFCMAAHSAYGNGSIVVVPNE